MEVYTHYYYFKDVCGWEISGREYGKGRKLQYLFLCFLCWNIVRILQAFSFFSVVLPSFFLASTDNFTDLAEKSSGNISWRKSVLIPLVLHENISLYLHWTFFEVVLPPSDIPVFSFWSYFFSLSPLWMQIGAATVESSMEIPQKIKNGSAFWLTNPTSEDLFKGKQNTNLKEHKHPYILCSIIYNC